MNYGLNNSLSTANDTLKTQNSAKRNKNFKIGNGLDVLAGFKNGKTGGERLKALLPLLIGM